MYCSHCGAPVDDDETLCPYCGQETSHPREIEPVAVSLPQQPSMTAALRRKLGCGWAMVAGMLAGVAILIIAALAIFGVYQGMQERARLNAAAAAEHYQKGLEQLRAENYELARAEFELAVQLDSRNRDAAAKLAEVNALLGGEATPTSATQQQAAMLLFNEARLLYNQSSWEGVVTKLEQVRLLDPDYESPQVTDLLVEAYYKGGLQLVDQDRLEEAIRYFDRALELRPAEATIREQQRLASLYVAGLSYWGANWQGAIDSFTVLHQLKRDYKDTEQRLYDAYVAYADTLGENGDWCAARDRYDSALAMKSSEELKAKREAAAQSCVTGVSPTGTPPPSGTFVGRLLKTEDVGLQTAMMIRGYVLDGAGRPVAGVRVGLSAWDWSAPPALTNAEGVFAFDGLGNPVTYTVTLLERPSVPMSVKADWSKLVWVEFRAKP